MFHFLIRVFSEPEENLVLMTPMIPLARTASSRWLIPAQSNFGLSVPGFLGAVTDNSFHSPRRLDLTG